MRTFNIMFTGDYLDETGRLSVPDIALDLLEPVPFIRHGFLRDQSPEPGDATYWDRLYSLEIEPQHLAQANGIVIFRPWVKASTFAAGAEDLVVIGRAGAGYDKIDLPACTAHDVAVFNAPDTLTHATASSAFLLMLALAKRLPEHERLVRQGRWELQGTVVGDDLIGQTLGIVGLGQTGMELARLVAPFHMRVIAYSPHADPAQAAACGAELVPGLDILLREADFISLHCRLTEHTRRMIGERELSLMKPTAYFINVARGEIVDQAALVRCLAARRIAGAGLDVYENEPLPAGDPLIALDNAILTPHWLPSTRQAARATMVAVAQGMLAAAQGQVPAHVLNPAVLERPGFRAKLARYTENKGHLPGVAR